MTDPEVEAEAFRIIRNNQEMPKASLWAFVKAGLPDVPDDQLMRAMKSLAEKA